MFKELRYSAESFLDVLYPRVCKACSLALFQHEQQICLNCLSRLPVTASWKQNFNPMELIFKGRMRFIYQYSFLNFEKKGLTQQLMHQIKYHKQIDLAMYLGRLFANEIQEISQSIDYLVPIPLHRKKYKKRGFNQAMKIAKGFQDIWDVPILEHGLVKTIDNVSQTTMSRANKFSNVKNTYDWDGLDVSKDAHLMLIDDVCTTGSTLEACGITLQKASFTNISVSTLAVVSPL